MRRKGFCAVSAAYAPKLRCAKHKLYIDLARGGCYNHGMDNARLEIEAKKLGFTRAFFVAPPRYGAETAEKSLDDHIIFDASALPFDVACMLVWAYLPYPAGERIPPYYINSNLSYHAAVALARLLEAEGVSCRRAELPVKSLLYDNNIAIPLKSSLAAIPPYGTRFAVQCLLLASDDNNPFRTEEYSVTSPGYCRTCRICEAACPAHAIHDGAMHVTECMRFYMDDADYPDWVYEKQTTHIGCEVCQQVCPYNAKLPLARPTEEQREAFDLERLADGDTKAARLLVGKNMTGRGKLQKEALNFLNRDKQN